VPTLKKLLYAANLLAGLGVAACVAASSTAAFEGVYEPVSAETVSSIRSPASIPRPEEYYSSCWKAGSPDSLSTQAICQDVGTMQAVSGRYRLYSTFFVLSDNKREGYAAIAHDRQERVYAENEKVGEYVLAQVFPDRVILKKGGASFTLERASGAGQGVSSSRSSSKTSRIEAPGRRRLEDKRPRAGRQGAAKSDKADIQQFTVSKEDKDYITDNFPKILHDVNLQTEITG
ncbi:unnamed protein product, partial [marine sediment metagenome]